MQFDLKKISISLLLTVVLMFPYWGAFSHLFEDHNHQTCEISETHLHEIDLDCDVLEYQLASSIQLSFGAIAIVSLPSQQKKTSFYYTGYSYSLDTVDKLRGPPGC
jgi:hypothetical protein